MPVCAATRATNPFSRAALAWCCIVICLLMQCRAHAQDEHPDATPAATAPYCIQVMVLSSKESAETYTAELRRKGYDASIVPMQTVNRGMMYRVRIGRFDNETAARRFGLLFTEREKTPHVVVKLQDAPAMPRSAPPEPKTPPPRDNETLEDIPDETDLPEETIAPPQAADNATKHLEPQPRAETQPRGQKSAPPDTLDAGSQSVIKIFAYRQSDGTLRLTNNYFSIPDNARSALEYISVFPVRFLSCAASGSHILCSVDGAEKPVKLAGVALRPGTSASLVADYFNRQIKKAPLRLRYSPWELTADGMIIGRLYLREGTFINPELLKNGIGAYCSETAPQDQKAAFQQAEAQARRDKKGIWTAP